MAIWYLNEAVSIHANGPSPAATASVTNVVPIQPPPTLTLGVAAAERGSESAVADVSITPGRTAPLADPPAKTRRSPQSAQPKAASRTQDGPDRRTLLTNEPYRPR